MGWTVIVPADAGFQQGVAKALLGLIGRIEADCAVFYIRAMDEHVPGFILLRRDQIDVSRSIGSPSHAKDGPRNRKVLIAARERPRNHARALGRVSIDAVSSDETSGSKPSRSRDVCQDLVIIELPSCRLAAQSLGFADPPHRLRFRDPLWARKDESLSRARRRHPTDK